MIAETTALDKWGYLVGIGMLLIIWCGLYILRKDLHRRMMTVSLITIPLAPLGQYYFLQDYWRSPLILPISLFGIHFGGVADLLFAFVMGGLATAIYPFFARRYPVSGIYKGQRWIVIAFVLLEGGSVIVLTNLFHINSIFSSSIGFFLAACVTVLARRDLLRCAVISCIASGIALAGAEGVLSFIVPLYLSRYWLLYHTQYGWLIFGSVPLTEFIWGAAFGLATGPLYDAYEGFSLVRKGTKTKTEN